MSSIEFYGEASSVSQDLPPDKMWNPWAPNIVRVIYYKDDSRSQVLMTHETGQWDFPWFSYKTGIEEGYRSTRLCRDFAKWIGQKRQFVYVAELIGLSVEWEDGLPKGIKAVVVETADAGESPLIDLPSEPRMQWKECTFLGDILDGIEEQKPSVWVPRRVDALEAALRYSSQKLTVCLSFTEPRLLLGWFRKARAFLISTIESEGETLHGTVVQHQSTMASTVLGAETTTGNLFFLKASAAGSQEMSITVCLAGVMPEYSVEVVSSDEELGCFVTRELTVGDVEMDDAVMTLGRMQRESVAHISQLKAAGCPVLDLKNIRRQLVKWLSGYHSMTSCSLSTYFKDEGWYILYLCRRLDSIKLPATLVHGDFSISNVGIAERRGSTLLYDWEFACISNPLLDFYRCTNLARTTSKISPELENKYLRLWTEYAPMDMLKEGLKIGKVLGRVLRVCSLWTRADACAHQLFKPSLDKWKTFETRVLYEALSDLKESDIEYWKSEEGELESKLPMDSSSE